MVPPVGFAVVTAVLVVLIGTAVNMSGGKPWAQAMTQHFTADHLPPMLIDDYAALSPDGRDHFPIVFTSLKSAQQFRWEARAARELGDALESADGGNWHDARDDGDVDAGQCTPFPEIEEVAIIEK